MSWLLAAARENPRHLIAAGAACGLALGSIDALAAFALACLALILCVATGLRAHVALATCALILTGYGIAGMRLASIDADPLAQAAPGPVALNGHIVQLPQVRPSGVSLRVRVTAANQLIEVRAPRGTRADMQIGDGVSARGWLQAVRPESARTPAARSYAEFLLRSGVRRRLIAKAVEFTGARRGGLTGVVDSIRSRAEKALAVGLAPEPAALLRGMVLGGDAGLPARTVEDFRIAGLSHILAVSGQNVLLIVILVQAILTGLGVGRSWRIGVPAAVVLLYVVLCGAQASVIRAGAMGLAGLAAVAASRPSARIYALILAAIVVLIWNPRATADVGAQLSFAAVLGLMAFTRPLADRFSRLPRWCAEALAATLGATIATAPLMALQFGAVSVISLVANVLGEPLIGPIVWLGSLSAAIGQFSTGMAGLLNAPTGFLLGTLIELAHACARIPGAQVEAGGFGTAAFLLATLGVALLALWLRGHLPEFPKLRLPVGLRLAVATLVVAAVWSVANGRRVNIARPAIVMLDVGQGDATLLLGDRCAALIDGGPPGTDLKEKLNRYGIKRIDALLITHPEVDHFGGALDLTKSGDLAIGSFLDGGGNTPEPGYAQLRSGLARARALSTPAVAGARWSCPGISISVIAPAALPPGAPPPTDPNTRAAVTVVEVGSLRMFASGDAESPQLLPLAIPPAGILKVSHHGSADPGLPALLERIRPRLALIGVGAQNRFGHPAPPTIAALDAAQTQIKRTDRDGDIIVTPAGVSTRGAER